MSLVMSKSEIKSRSINKYLNIKTERIYPEAEGLLLGWEA